MLVAQHRSTTAVEAGFAVAAVCWPVFARPAALFLQRAAVLHMQTRHRGVLRPLTQVQPACGCRACVDVSNAQATTGYTLGMRHK